MTQVNAVTTRRRDGGFLESEARVEVADSSRISAGDLDLSALDHVQSVTIAQSGSGVDTSNPQLVTQASLHKPGTAANSITVGLHSLSGGTFGSLTASAGSAIVHVTARGAE